MTGFPLPPPVSEVRLMYRVGRLMGRAGLRQCLRIGAALLFVAAARAELAAQATVSESRGPRFFFVTSSKGAPTELGSAPMLRRPISMSLQDVPLKDALDEI